MFERFKAGLRVKFWSLRTLARREWTNGTKIQEREDQEREALNSLEGHIEDARRLGSNHATEIQRMLEQGELDVKKIELLQKDLEKRLQRVVTSQSTVMIKNFELAYDLLEEFTSVLKVLKKKHDERAHARIQTIGSAADAQEYARLIQQVQETFDKLFAELGSLMQIIQTDLDTIALDYRKMQTRLVSADLMLASSDTITSIAKTDLQKDNVYLRDAQTFRKHVKFRIEQLKTAIEKADLFNAHAFSGSAAGFEDIKEALDNFEESYFNLLGDFKQMLSSEYRLLNEDLIEIVGTYERINKISREVILVEGRVTDKKSEKLLKQIAQGLTILGTSIKDGVAYAGKRLEGSRDFLRRNTQHISLRNNWVRATAALMVLVIGTSAITSTAKADESTRRSEQEKVLTLPSAEDRAEAKRRVATLVQHIRQNPLLFQYSEPEFSINVSTFAQLVSGTLGLIDLTKFTVIVEVQGSSSPDHGPGKEAGNLRLSENRGEQLTVKMRPALDPRIIVRQADVKGVIAPLPKDASGAEVSLDEVRQVAARMDIQKLKPQNEREQGIYEYLVKTRQAIVTVTVKEKATEKIIIHTMVLPGEQPPAIIPEHPKPEYQLHEIRYPVTYESISSAGASQQGSNRSMVTHRFAPGSQVSGAGALTQDAHVNYRNLNVDFRNLSIKRAQLWYARLDREGKIAFDAVYGVKEQSLMRNMWVPQRFFVAAEAALAAVNKDRQEGLKKDLFNLMPSVYGSMEQLEFLVGTSQTKQSTLRQER